MAICYIQGEGEEREMEEEKEEDRNNNSLVLSLYSDKFPSQQGVGAQAGA